MEDLPSVGAWSGAVEEEPRRERDGLTSTCGRDHVRRGDDAMAGGGIAGWRALGMGERHRFDQVRVPGVVDPAQQGTHTTVAVP
ncbi:MAG: hypothetical protein ACRDP8_13690 [Actinopolymorphaceae bacterium]